MDQVAGGAGQTVVDQVEEGIEGIVRGKQVEVDERLGGLEQCLEVVLWDEPDGTTAVDGVGAIDPLDSHLMRVRGTAVRTQLVEQALEPSPVEPVFPG